MRWLVIFLILLSACVPPTTTPTAKPPTITPTRPPSPIVTPTPPVSPLSLPPQPISPTYTISNALSNGGMDSPYKLQAGTNTISAPHDWFIGWLPKPPCTHEDNKLNGCLPVITCPTNCILPNGNCSNDYACYFAMPEASRILAIEFEGLRVFEGDASAKIFANRMWTAWYSQTDEVGIGNPVTFSVKLQAWMCGDFANCSKGQRSDLPTAMHLRVGIDPFGGRIVTSTNVLWSAEGDAYRIDKNSPDIWHTFSVSAIARARNVTVFIYANPDWSLPALDFPQLYDYDHARQNNDLYIDDARLSVKVLYPIRKVYLPMVRR